VSHGVETAARTGIGYLFIAVETPATRLGSALECLSQHAELQMPNGNGRSPLSP
jgi:hypothetical protein